MIQNEHWRIEMVALTSKRVDAGENTLILVMGSAEWLPVNEQAGKPRGNVLIYVVTIWSPSLCSIESKKNKWGASQGLLEGHLVLNM